MPYIKELTQQDSWKNKDDTVHSQSYATFFRHSAVLSVPAVLLRKLPINLINLCVLIYYVLRDFSMRNQKYNSQYHGNGAMYDDDALREFDPEIAHTVSSQVFGQVHQQAGRARNVGLGPRKTLSCIQLCLLPLPQ